ncbi:MAG: cysteine desulfurase [Anaerolineae bacterium]|nr:cysteine desulfurase [Anaerolineae bacterium]
MKKVYLDYGAATPIHPQAIEAMIPYLGELFGNPQTLHDWGQEAKEAIEEARGKVASLIGAQPEEIIFTSSGTEANNLALKGVAWAQERKGNHIVTSQIEHHSALHSLKSLERQGFTYTPVPVDRYGLVDLASVEEAITQETILVSIMHANNEVGTIEPLGQIAEIAKRYGLPFHTDAVQTVGTIPINVEELGVDLLSLSGQGFYGPKGAGALYLRRGAHIIPFIDGGIQEGGRRAGTENVAGIVGLGVAADLAKREMSNRANHLTPLRDRLIEGLLEIHGVYLTGHPKERLPGHVSVVAEYVEGEAMLLSLNLKGIAASSGSACTSRALKASHVLEAMGIDPALAQGSLLLTLGMGNTMEEVNYLLEVFPPIVKRLREISPLYHR